MKAALLMAAALAASAVGILSLSSCASNGDASCGAPAAARDETPRPLVVLGDDLSPLREAFNAASGRWRVVALVSPTCSECLLGADAVQQELTARYAPDRLAALIVWIPMLQTDDEAAARDSATLFPPDRVLHFYDGAQSLGLAYTRGTYAGLMERARRSVPAGDPLAERLTEREEVERPQWDLYMLYAPGVRWEAGAGATAAAPPMPTHWIRHCGRNAEGLSTWWRDSPDTPPQRGQLIDAMRAMADAALAGVGPAATATSPH